MLLETERRAAHLAVARYGADRGRVEQAIQTVAQAKADGRSADLLALLVVDKLLSPSQAQELRDSLETTQLDPHAPQNGRATNGSGNGHVEELGTLGEYRLLRRLGDGGMGTVYLAYHPAEKRQVALKVLAPHLATSQASLDRFRREARSGFLLNHPNIVRILGVGHDRPTGRHYLVLEYVDGPSAHSLLERFGKLPVGDAVHVALDIARALEHAHSRNVIHRDIKPANILVTRSGIARLADLGLAKRTDEASHLTATRQGFGTPYYMPYEQAMNAKSADARSDIYALGATLYHLLVGEVPFPGSNHLEIVEKKSVGTFAPASSLNPDVPPALDRILGKMLAREPRDRYQTASELIVELERSELAAAVPSFADRDLALQDPVMRQRLTAPAQATCPDLQRPAPAPPAANTAVAPDRWFVRYRDRSGRWCKAKATTAQICQRLREGRISPQVEVCQTPDGDFQSLAGQPVFQEAVETGRKRRARKAVERNASANGEAAVPLIKPPRPVRAARSWRRFLVVGALAAALGLLALILFFAEA